VSVAINNPETGEEQTISGLKEPFKLKFQTGNPSNGQTFRCFYYNEINQKWSDDGITSIVIGGELRCSSTHLTSFSPADVHDNSTQSSGERNGRHTTTESPITNLNQFKSLIVMANCQSLVINQD
jgi:hypothetical protein